MPIQDRDYYRERRGTAPRPQVRLAAGVVGGSSRGGGGSRVATAVSPGAGSSGGRGCSWFLLVLLLIAIIGGVWYYYWSTSQEMASEPVPTPTPAPQAVHGETPTPSPVPAAATATSTPFPCADPTKGPCRPLRQHLFPILPRLPLQRQFRCRFPRPGRSGCGTGVHRKSTLRWRRSSGISTRPWRAWMTCRCVKRVRLIPWQPNRVTFMLAT